MTVRELKDTIKRLEELVEAQQKIINNQKCCGKVCCYYDCYHCPYHYRYVWHPTYYPSGTGDYITTGDKLDNTTITTVNPNVTFTITAG